MSRLPAADRAVVVLTGDGQGSGVLLTPRYVLTSAHTVSGGSGNGVSVAHPSRAGEVSCAIAWTNAELDAALLYAEFDVLDTEQATGLGRIRLGKIDTRSALAHCEVIGFPGIQRHGARDAIESDQYEGTVLPMASRLRNSLVFETERPPAAERADGGSPLAGLSGAPVFAGAVLLGIVTNVPRGRAHRRMEGVTVRTVLDGLRLDNTRSDLRLFVNQLMDELVLIQSGMAAASWTRRRSSFSAPGHLPPRWEKVSEFHPSDHLFEQEYARSLKARYRKTRIFGIDELGVNEAAWDLDTAYLGLEAESARRDAHTPASQPRRIDALLTDRPHTLLRGEAGAGKTTLVWWLAAHMACGTLGPDLASLNGLVPFVVPMRVLRAQGGELPTPAELPAVARILADEAPSGWVRRVLTAGRGFLLVDGLDEVPTADRDAARAWLGELLSLFPLTRCLATVRPLAVEENWLHGEGFDELRLLPMRDEDVRTFVSAWHRAARLERHEDEDLEGLEADLLQQLDRNTALRGLAHTPLLCAVICALHRRHGGMLPDTRWKLYRATLDMLLGARDARRKVDGPEGIRMSVEEHQELLQAIATWLVRGGQTQLSHAEAEQQIDLALRHLTHVRDQGPPRAVLTHLLNRSGLLQERTDDVIQFIHRTFQDYLAAKEFVESGSLKELLRHANDEQWQDVLLMAVGHCRRAELAQLIRGLIAVGDESPDAEIREALHVLAARCSLETALLDNEVRDEVAERIRAMLPPDPERPVGNLASLGSYVLSLLPEIETLDDDGAHGVARLVAGVGGAEALPYARLLSRHENSHEVLANSWSSYPAEAYAGEVLTRLPLHDMWLPVYDSRQLSQLHRFGRVASLYLEGPFTERDLARHLPTIRARSLEFASNPLLDNLDSLRGQTELHEVGLDDCVNLTHFRTLADLPVRRLSLNGSHSQVRAALNAVGRAPRISELVLETRSLSIFAPVIPLPGVTTLRLDQVRDYKDIEEIQRAFPAIRALHMRLRVDPKVELDLSPLADLPDLEIVVGADSPRLTVIGEALFGDRLTINR